MDNYKTLAQTAQDRRNNSLTVKLLYDETIPHFDTILPHDVWRMIVDVTWKETTHSKLCILNKWFLYYIHTKPSITKLLRIAKSNFCTIPIYLACIRHEICCVTNQRATTITDEPLTVNNLIGNSKGIISKQPFIKLPYVGIINNAEMLIGERNIATKILVETESNKLYELLMPCSLDAEVYSVFPSVEGLQQLPTTVRHDLVERIRNKLDTIDHISPFQKITRSQWILWQVFPELHFSINTSIDRLDAHTDLLIRVANTIDTIPNNHSLILAILAKNRRLVRHNPFPCEDVIEATKLGTILNNSRYIPSTNQEAECVRWLIETDSQEDMPEDPKLAHTNQLVKHNYSLNNFFTTIPSSFYNKYNLSNTLQKYKPHTYLKTITKAEDLLVLCPIYLLYAVEHPKWNTKYNKQVLQQLLSYHRNWRPSPTGKMCGSGLLFRKIRILLATHNSIITLEATTIGSPLILLLLTLYPTLLAAHPKTITSCATINTKDLILTLQYPKVEPEQISTILLKSNDIPLVFQSLLRCLLETKCQHDTTGQVVLHSANPKFIRVWRVLQRLARETNIPKELLFILECPHCRKELEKLTLSK